MQVKIQSLFLVPLLALWALPADGQDTAHSGSADTGRIYFYRTTSEGNSIRPSVRIDGEPVGRAIPHRHFYVDLPAGSYEITAARKTDISLSVDIAPGDINYVRLDVEILIASWRVTPVLVPAAIGETEMQETEFKGR